MSAEKAIVKKFLDSQETGVLAVVDENNKPHAATINYVTDDDLNLYFITKTATKKFASLSQNPHVAMTVTDMDSKKTVQIEGQAHEAKDIDQQSEIMKKLASPHKDSSGVWVPPIAEI